MTAQTPTTAVSARRLLASDLTEGMRAVDHVGRLFVIAAVEHRTDGRIALKSEQPRRWGSFAPDDQFVVLAPDAPSVTLHKTAPWNPRLRNGYRDRYATANGRFYKVYAEWLNAPWWVTQIDADGVEIVSDTYEVVFLLQASTLADARAIIAADAAREEQS